MLILVLLTGVLSSGMLVAQTLSVHFDNNKPLQQVPLARGLNRLGSSPNTLLLSMARTAYRENRYQWIGPFFESADALYAKADSTLSISSLDDAKMVGAIGVYRGDVSDQTLTALGFTNLDRANSNSSNVKKLMAGRIALFACSPTNLQALAEQACYQQDDFKLIRESMHKQLYVAASPSTDATGIAKWNEGLVQMKRDRTFEKIFKTHFPSIGLPGHRQTQMPTLKQRFSPVAFKETKTTAIGLKELNGDVKTIRTGVTDSVLTEVEQPVFLALAKRDYF